MKAINNQHQQVLWYLINWNQFSLMDVIKDSMFYKFQSRLGEIEAEHGTLCKRTQTKFINRFGRKSTVTSYERLDVEKCKSIFNLMTRF